MILYDNFDEYYKLIFLNTYKTFNSLVNIMKPAPVYSESDSNLKLLT
jgi:hypothetical protein